MCLYNRLSKHSQVRINGRLFISMCAWMLDKFGSKELKEEYLEKLSTMEVFWIL